MIEFTKGDMFAMPVDARVNTVNCKGVMGAGVALAFKNRYPDMFKEYKQKCQDGTIRPGALHVWKNLMGDWVINFPTKRDWKEKSRYEDVSAGLEALRSYLQEQKPASLALPALGCGHGGLDWNKVSSMIKEKLGDLDTKIFVFEPADSRNAGRIVNSELSDEQVQNLKELGFKSIERPHQYTNEGLPTVSWLKGDESLLNQKWVALLPSKAPAERELKALNAIACQIALASKQIVVALVYANRTTENIADIFLKRGISVVLILPFCPLTRKSIGYTLFDQRNIPFSIISVASPNQAWGRTIFAQSMKMLLSGAFCALFSDPSPESLKNNSIRSWSARPLFYIRYENQSDDIRHMLEREGVRPIGRRSDSGEPNLIPLLGGGDFSEANSEQLLVKDKGYLDDSLILVTATQLEEIAATIKSSKNPDTTVGIFITKNFIDKDLSEKIYQILAR
ncbi:macro domain-containing protein [Methylomonas sp. BW4-1]|uniref:macro domain-containing protein n=1 Tax=Methylomonas sp. BW4-1 TaxID=3376685 RepID=UPI004042827E